ncbi:MAG TPA: hypothetical protein DHV07_02030 [Flavobacteriales bacterium]|jgi:hypothetical protein|nr:hypothetical protein [Flavobacteriales bacterium]
MKCHAALLVAAAAIWSTGCQSPDPLPWKLVELGTEPITSAWERGEAVAAEIEGDRWPGFIFAHDSSTQGRIARRDAKTLPVIMCGDKMRLHPKDLPLGWSSYFSWEGRDSLTVQWRCYDRAAIARFGSRLLQTSATPQADEQRWLETLRLSDPEVFTSPSARYRSGDLVRLVIECQRPDGSPVGDTVRLDFRLGEQDQVVTALEPGLSQAGPGAHWTVWALSSNAFGSQPQPKLGLPAHTPLKFSVVAE